MDIVSAGVILVFCLVGALVALLADNLGRSIGKKRLSILKLRPKHTAAVFILLGGFLIPLMTVAMMAAFSKDLRTILREGSRLVSERDKVRQELGDAEARLAKANTATSAAEAKRAVAQNNLNVANKGLDLVRTELKTSKTTIATLQSQSASIRTKLGRLQSSLAAIQVKLSSREKLLTQRNADLAVLESNRKVFVNQLKEFNQRFNELNDEIDELKRQKVAIEAQSADAGKTLVLQQKQIEETQKQLDRKLEEVSALNARVDQLNKQVEDLAASAQETFASASFSRTAPMIFARDTELARIIIPVARTIPEADRLVAEALKEAGKRAVDRGARDQAPYKSADFFPRNSSSGRVTPEMERAALRADILRIRAEHVLILAAAWNSFAEEAVPVRAKLLPNIVAFPAGVIISETRIDGDASEKAITDRLTEWIRVELGSALERAGVIPNTGSEDRFGTISIDQVLKLVREIKGEGRRLRVQALSTAEIRAAGPVKLEIRLR